MADDFSAVKATYDKPSYVGGDIITITITGQATSTTDTTRQVGPVIIPIVAADGAKSTITVATTTVTFSSSTPQAVIVDSSAPIVDNSPTPLTWVIAADGKSIHAQT